MKIYTVTLMDADGNRDPEAATCVVGAFQSIEDAQLQFHELLDEAMEGRDCEFEHSEDEFGGQHYKGQMEGGCPLEFIVWPRNGLHFAMDDEFLWSCKIEETELA